jgi:predicted 2-oxoglutarate/Fe(II)-dependent dioxygenase YbiX
MLITIPDVLTVGEVAQARAALDAAGGASGDGEAG